MTSIRVGIVYLIASTPKLDSSLGSGGQDSWADTTPAPRTRPHVRGSLVERAAYRQQNRDGVGA